MARHQDLTENHRLESYVYADAAGRTGASGFITGDIGRIAYQTDTGEYYRLTATTPAWALIALPTTATFTTGTVYNPTGTASATGVMMGMGTVTYGSAAITPVRSGKVHITISGWLSHTSATGATQVAVKYGTGTAPVNGAAFSGTTLQGSGVPLRLVLGANIAVPFSISGIATGLTLGTIYWIDLMVVAYAGGATASAGSVGVCAFELP